MAYIATVEGIKVDGNHADRKEGYLFLEYCCRHLDILSESGPEDLQEGMAVKSYYVIFRILFSTRRRSTRRRAPFLKIGKRVIKKILDQRPFALLETKCFTHRGIDVVIARNILKRDATRVGN